MTVPSYKVKNTGQNIFISSPSFSQWCDIKLWRDINGGRLSVRSLLHDVHRTHQYLWLFNLDASSRVFRVYLYSVEEHRSILTMRTEPLLTSLWCTSLIPAFRRQSQLDIHEFDSSLVYKASSRTEQPGLHRETLSWNNTHPPQKATCLWSPKSPLIPPVVVCTWMFPCSSCAMVFRGGTLGRWLDPEALTIARDC